ncbi:hypothetical protein [Faecalibaculum rodentium]|nr:hypothetical protein [Faecalibaculum rodentium]
MESIVEKIITDLEGLGEAEQAEVLEGVICGLTNRPSRLLAIITAMIKN